MPSKLQEVRARVTKQQREVIDSVLRPGERITQFMFEAVKREVKRRGKKLPPKRQWGGRRIPLSDFDEEDNNG